MTESQSDAAHEAPLTNDAAEFDSTSPRGTEATQTIPVATEAWRGSLGRNEWLPLPWEESGNTADPNPAGPRQVRMGKKSAWTLGGAAAIAIAVAALVGMSLSGATARTASSSVSPRASAPYAGRPMPSASALASSHRAPSASPSASSPKAAEPHTASAPAFPSAATSAQPAAAGLGAAGTKPATAPQRATISVPEPVASWCTSAANGDCATFNGTDSQFTTSGPVLNTAPGSSFTVSAWVYMAAFTPNDGFETIVSQDGVYDSGFYLQYSGADHRWAFARVTEDTDNGPPGIRALSTSAPSLSTWTHLVGVFDASDNQLRLYVNGVLEGTATDTSPFVTTGHLAIGRAQFDGQPTDWFHGAANQIKAYNVALTTAQIDQI
jgi:hypothetical protein